ncbi:hypothetical protein Q0F98_18275 [Paenibacillus amylolyticus]|nr:hypothetical protein Q0F98_18275 [Paenibacillus amylolyticus]
MLKPAEVEEIESVLREVLLEQDVRERHERLERTYKQEVGRVLPVFAQTIPSRTADYAISGRGTA